jgi:hypothetical protein
VQHQVAEPGAGADPFADHGADRRDGAATRKPGAERRQRRRQADLEQERRPAAGAHLRARSSQPGSVRRSPSKNAAVTGKKMISVAITTFDAMP